MDLLILDFFGKYNKASVMLETAIFPILRVKKFAFCSNKFLHFFGLVAFCYGGKFAK